MSKKRIIFVVAGVIILVSVVAVGICFFRRAKVERPITPFLSSLPTSIPTTKEGKLLSYTDEAGFSFNYPDFLSVKEVENQDENTYSALEIFSPSTPDQKLAINVSDTNFSNTEEWLVKNKKSGWSVNETVLSGMNGKFIRTSDKLITIAISKGILFLIESPITENNFWENQHKIISESLTIKWPAEIKSATGETSIFEGEVIE